MERVNFIRQGTVWVSLLATLGAGMFLWAGDGGLLSKEEVKTLITSAKTAQDHQRLAQHFDAKADQLEAESKEHQELAAHYKAHPTIHEMKHPGSPQTAGHCQYFADDLHKASLRARQMATDHREMGKQAAK